MKARTTGSILIFAAAMAIAVVCLCFRSVPVEAVYPVERAKMGLFKGLRTRARAWFRAQEAAVENVRLKREVASLARMVGDVERLEVENARLRRALDYRSKSGERWVAAEVLTRGGAAAGNDKTLRIGKGSLAGIVNGAIVAVPEGLVGRVMSVTPHTAEVVLVTDSRIQVACEIETVATPKPHGVLMGEREGLLVLKHLRNVGDVPSRARVLTSGLGGVFPRGLEIGTLQAIRAEGPKLVTEGEVLPSVDFASLEDVFVCREK